jgi:putative oxidoreductase
MVLLLLRVTAGVLMLTHGYGKLQMLLNGGPYAFADPFGLGHTITLVVAVFAEFICSILIILGVFTRLAAIPLIITMMTAAIIIHSGDPIGNRELSILFGVIFIALAFFGAGKYSVDYLMKK